MANVTDLAEEILNRDIICDANHLLITFTDATTLKVDVDSISQFIFKTAHHHQIIFEEIPLYWVLGSEKVIDFAQIQDLKDSVLADVTNLLLSNVEAIDPELSSITLSWIVSEADTITLFS